MAKPARIELPADLASEYTPPEGATLADLDAMIAQVRVDAEKLLADDNGTTDADERIAQANWLISAIAKMTDRKTQIATDEQERADRLAEVRNRLKGEQTDPENPDDGDDKDDDEGGEGVVQNGDAVDDAAAGAQVGEPVLVASSAVARRRSAISDARRGSGRTQQPVRKAQPREAYLTASAEVAGFAAGAKLTFEQMGAAAESRFRALPSSLHKGGARVQLGIGSVNVPSDERLVASAAGRGSDLADLDEAIEWAVSRDRLKQETGEDTLLAAGGWCAPSETLYDLIDLTTTDGMMDVPGITVTRGGVRYSLGPDFTAVYNSGANFTKTEAQAIAGSAKPVVNIPCPTFTDNRMVVDGMYLTGDILSQKGYPEAYADFISKSLKAHAHYVNAQSIADQVALSTAVDLTQGGSPPPYQNKAISTELLGGIELQVTDMRYKNRLGINDAVELKIPLWLRGAVRSDLAKRQGVENAANISDADIAAYFAVRGASVEWVYDWQDAFTGVSGGFGAATAVKAWPTSAQFLIYPQGTFVRALSDVIELNAVYDSLLLQTNQFVALFIEQARLTLKRAWDARVVTVPVNVSGATGAAIDYTALQPTV